MTREERHLRRRRWVLLVAGASAAVLTAPACRADGTGPAATGSIRDSGARSDEVSGSITVAAASSLKVPFERLGAELRRIHPDVAAVTFTFDSSSSLARQIVEDGAPVDVFAAADDTSMATVTAAGHADAPRMFARNTLAIAVKRGNPTGIDDLSDLAAADTIALCGPDAPCGRYADELLASAGISLPPDRVSRGQNARATVGAVADGDADVAIVYRTDITGDRLEAVPIPDDRNVIASYPIAALRDSANPATARAFVELVLGPQGRAALADAGFLAPA